MRFRETIIGIIFLGVVSSLLASYMQKNWDSKNPSATTTPSPQQEPEGQSVPESANPSPASGNNLNKMPIEAAGSTPARPTQDPPPATVTGSGITPLPAQPPRGEKPSEKTNLSVPEDLSSGRMSNAISGGGSGTSSAGSEANMPAVVKKAPLDRGVLNQIMVAATQGFKGYRYGKPVNKVNGRKVWVSSFRP